LPHKSQLEFNNSKTSLFACPDEAKKAWDTSGNSGPQVIAMAADDEISIDGIHTKNAEPVLSSNKMEIAEKLSNDVEDDLNRRRDQEGTAPKNLSTQIFDYFTKIVSENPIARKHIDMTIQLIADGSNGGEFVLDMKSDNNNGPFVEERITEDWNYFMKIPAHLVQKAVKNELLWETLFLSCRWEGDRNPDRWNEHFINLLYDPDPTRITNIYKIYDRTN